MPGETYQGQEREYYFLAHINRGVELLMNHERVTENLALLIKVGC